MESSMDSSQYSVGVLVISDTVSAGQKADLSGSNIVKLLQNEKHFSFHFLQNVADDVTEIQRVLKYWADDVKIDLILTVGGTGFTPRDVTPEATKSVIDREAPHLASRMVLGCCEKTPFAILSRSVCGIRRNSLILNLPGSKKGSQECFEMVANVLPHALDQLKDKKGHVSSLHAQIQGSDTERDITQ